MQQAVVSTQNSLAPPTISIVISSFNRNFIRNKINYFIQTINTCLQDLSSVFDEKANTVIIDESKLNSSSETKSLENLRNIFLQLKQDYFKANAIENDLNQTLILDPILKPFFDENSLNILKDQLDDMIDERNSKIKANEQLNSLIQKAHQIAQEALSANQVKLSTQIEQTILKECNNANVDGSLLIKQSKLFIDAKNFLEFYTK